MNDLLASRVRGRRTWRTWKTRYGNCIRWIAQIASPPPTRLEVALGGIELAHEIRAALSELLPSKRVTRELGAAPANPVLMRFIAAEIARVLEGVAALPDPALAEDDLNALLWAELGLA
jgi:hypothetical protein